MDNITWLDILKMLVPITVVIIAGWLALLRMRENVRLDAKLKWKEEFRNRIVEFVKISMQLGDKIIWMEESDDISEKDGAKEYININQNLHTIYYAIEMMLDLDDIRTEVLRAIYRVIIESAYNEVISPVEIDNEEINNSIEEFYEIAKEIYDDDRYISSLVR